jgi:hypothetical protein
MAGGAEFNLQKFKELILYFADQSREDPGFAQTKLNKLLYSCDFEAFRRLGHSNTDATYQKLEWVRLLGSSYRSTRSCSGTNGRESNSGGVGGSGSG